MKKFELNCLATLTETRFSDWILQEGPRIVPFSDTNLSLRVRQNDSVLPQYTYT